MFHLGSSIILRKDKFYHLYTAFFLKIFIVFWNEKIGPLVNILKQGHLSWFFHMKSKVLRIVFCMQCFTSCPFIRNCHKKGLAPVAVGIRCIIALKFKYKKVHFVNTFTFYWEHFLFSICLMLFGLFSAPRVCFSNFRGHKTKSTHFLPCLKGFQSKARLDKHSIIQLYSDRVTMHRQRTVWIYDKICLNRFQIVWISRFTSYYP